MSEATDEVAPEAVPAEGAVAPLPPGDVPAVDDESAEWRKRYNGLQAKHQEALGALAEERRLRYEEAQARLQEGNQTVSEDTESLSEVQLLRQELKESRLATAKADALREFPDAEAFADMIVGNNATEVRELTRAFAERARTLKGEASEPVLDDGEETLPPPPPAQSVSPGSVTAPVIAGGLTAPGVPTTAADALADSRRIAMQKPEAQDAWDAFFYGKLGVESAENLA